MDTLLASHLCDNVHTLMMKDDGFVTNNEKAEETGVWQSIKSPDLFGGDRVMLQVLDPFKQVFYLDANLGMTTVTAADFSCLPVRHDSCRLVIGQMDILDFLNQLF